MNARAPAMIVPVMAFLLMAACPRVPPTIEHPHVDVGEVVALPASSADRTIRIRLRATNPNDFAFTARAMDWELATASTGPRRGRVELDQTIPARSSANLDITIHIPEAASMTTSMTLTARSYRLSGTLHLMSERRDIGAVFEARGDLVSE